MNSRAIKHELDMHLDNACYVSNWRDKEKKWGQAGLWTGRHTMKLDELRPPWDSSSTHLDWDMILTNVEVMISLT